MIAFLFIIIGLIIGSFLNVCIWRIPRKESIAFPPSHCPVCGKNIKPYDNIPVISYLLLNGKCRNCKTSISLRYPLIELVTGILFLLLYLKFGLSFDLAINIVLVSALIVITFIDLDHKIIPNIISLPLIALFFLISVIRYFISSDLQYLIISISGILAGGGTLYLIAIASRGNMGGGDIKLAALLGSVLGWEKTILMLFLSFISGGLISLILIIMGRKSRKDMIPFGPFLSIAGIIAIFYGNEIISWYLWGGHF